MTRKILSVVFMVLLIAPASLAAPKWLVNDGFGEGGMAYYQQGFIANEILASVFVPDPGDYPAKLTKVHTLVQDGTPGGGAQEIFVLYIWQDNGVLQPGTLLYSEGYLLVAADAFNEADLSELDIVIPSGNIRVGWEFVENPPPSFCRDADGNIKPHRNLIYGEIFGVWKWVWSENAGLQGDWIHRLQIDTNYSGATPTPVPTATPTWTPVPTDTPTPLPTDTPTPEPTDTPTNTPTPTPTEEPSPGTPTVPPETQTPEPTLTPTPLPTDTPIPTDTPAFTPTNTPTDIPTATPTEIPTATPTQIPTDTPTPVPPTPTPDDGTIYWDRETYFGLDARGILTVEDWDLDTDPLVQETVNVYVWSQQTDPYPGGLVVTLYETGTSSRTFRSIVPHIGFGPATLPSENIIGVTDGERVFARYLDKSSGEERIAAAQWFDETLSLDLQMPAKSFGTGDMLWCDLYYTNTGKTVNVDLYVLLQVFDEFFSYPTWPNLNSDLTYETMTIAAGQEGTVSIIPAFEVPPISPFGPIYFYAAMFSAGHLDIDSLVTNVDIAEFYFH